MTARGSASISSHRPRSSTGLPPLPCGFYDRDVADVARNLLGKLLVHRSREGITAGRIVEVEAYLAAGDTAAHSHRGKTLRNAAMFGPPGRAYVYAIHSRWCVNVVTQAVGAGSAVLIRAVEPVRGVELMCRRRLTDKTLHLARGPARLCEAFALDRAFDHWDLTRGRRLWIASTDRDGDAFQIGVSTRIGVTSAKNLPLRFTVAGNPFVSRPRWPLMSVQQPAL